MSRFITKKEDGTYLEAIESMEVCKWKLNEVCCNEKSVYLADYPSPFCKCASIKDCDFFEKEDGIIEEDKQ